MVAARHSAHADFSGVLAKGRIASADPELEHETLHEVAIGRIEEPDRKKPMALENRLGMRQLAKAFFTVVGAHARVAGAAEWRVVVHHVPAPIVDRHAASVRAAQDRFTRGDTVAE